MTARQQGIFHKFDVRRTDGRDAPGEKHHGAEYFVLDITDDPFSIPALVAYAKACANEYPALAAELQSKVDHIQSAASEYITVPEVTLPNGMVVPSFRVAKHLSSKGANDQPISVESAPPWIDINYHEARAAAERAGFQVLTESQALAIAYDVSQQAINWTGGAVGEGDLYQGLRNDTYNSAQPANVDPTDPSERRWLQLSTGERIYDFAGNAYSWIVDDIQGDAQGLTTIIAADSPSLTTAPYPSRTHGMGWRPAGECDWSGYALIRGGCWNARSRAGAFYLNVGWPGYRGDVVGFRCTLPIGL